MVVAGRGPHQAEPLTERTTTSPWPARRETTSRVFEVADAREEHLGTEEGEETLGGPPPAAPRLGEVLQASHREEALAAALAHHGR